MKMNNLTPIELKRVGPGLGIGPDVAAAGGFQQFFQIRPHNVNEEKLVTLPGGKGPSDALVKTSAGIGVISHHAKESKTFTRNPAQGRAGGQGGELTAPTPRSQEIKTERLTIRSQTGLRGDTLEFGTAGSLVARPYADDKAIPGQSSVTNRDNPDRPGNAGRMNVRGNPVDVVGALAKIRPESAQQPIGGVNGTRFQNYTNNETSTVFNVKGETGRNPRATPASLDVAIQQLERGMVPLTRRPVIVSG